MHQSQGFCRPHLRLQDRTLAQGCALGLAFAVLGRPSEVDERAEPQRVLAMPSDVLSASYGCSYSLKFWGSGIPFAEARNVRLCMMLCAASLLVRW